MALNRLLGSRPRNAPAVAALAIARLLVACGGSNASAPGPDPGGFGGALVGAGGSDVSGGGAGVSAGGAGAGVGGAGTSCNASTAGVMGVCMTYPPSSIAAMRAALASGCFELAHVGLVARTDSPTEPRLYVQDKSGGDGSAILAKCAATATHLCAPAVKAKIPLLLDTMTDGAQISLRGYYQYGTTGGFEEFYIAPIPLTIAEVSRDARTTAKWFRRADLAIVAADPLTMYDFSPSDLNLAAPQCPDYTGFAMIPKSAGMSAPAGCSGTTNPAARANDPREVLVGRQFFNQFLFSADCNCSGATRQRLVSTTSTVSGSLRGYLILEQDKASTVTYQVFEAAADQTFPIR